MYGVLKFVFWTCCAVGFGIYLAKGDLNGRPPLEHMESAWKQTFRPPSVDKVKDGPRDAYEDAKDTLSSKTAPAKKAERYSEDERAAIQKLIAEKPHK